LAKYTHSLPPDTDSVPFKVPWQKRAGAGILINLLQDRKKGGKEEQPATVI